MSKSDAEVFEAPKRGREGRDEPQRATGRDPKWDSNHDSVIGGCAFGRVGGAGVHGRAWSGEPADGRYIRS